MTSQLEIVLEQKIVDFKVHFTANALKFTLPLFKMIIPTGELARW